MKKIKRIVSGVLAAVMVAASASFASAAKVTFTDVNSHWAWQRGYISYLVEKNVINGYKQNDGTYMFKPEDTVTRAEFIKMLDETFGLTETANIKNKYNDVKESDWFYSYFAKAVEQGYILNYNQTANPNGELSREEATSLLVRYLELPENEKVATTTFTDYAKINALYRNDVLKAAKAGVINGYAENDGTYFKPQNTLTRAEALTILYRAAGIIFTADTTGAEAGAYEKNAVVKNGGVTLTNQNLDGRVIVSEGADSGTIAFYRSKINDTLYIRGGANIVLDSVAAKTVVVDSKDIINITVQAGSTIENLIINERTNIMLGKGTTVNQMTTTMGAQYTNVSGTGTIKKANIASDDFASSMIPEEYEIAKGITATFAAKSYSGTSALKDAFTATPFVTVESLYHCVNLTAVESGTVRYYFTNSASCPDAADFNAYYNAATVGNSFEVKANKAEAKITEKYDLVKNYKYIVLQLQVGEKLYLPVVISNEAASGTGFLTAPYLKDQKKIEFTTQAAGTVYYMYSDSATLTINEFLREYDAQIKSLKGETTSRTAAVEVKDAYASMNSYMVFMFKSAAGVYYTPVAVSLGDSGFFVDPEANEDGSISATPNTAGILYYYYTDEAAAPTASKFESLWLSAGSSYRSYETVKMGKEVTIPYKNNLPDGYVYVVMSVCNADEEFMTPVVVKLEGENGYSILPEVTAAETIRFKPSSDGVVYYYYTKDAKVPSVKTFTSEYNGTSTGYRSNAAVIGGTVKTITFDDTKAAIYPYMAIMLENEDGKTYQPVVVSLTATTSAGFATAPYIDGKTIKLKTASDCEVWWYYARFDTAVTDEHFAGKWELAMYGNKTYVEKGDLEVIDIDTDILDSFPYIVFATTTIRGEVFSDPVIVSLKSVVPEDNSSIIGFKVNKNANNQVTLTAYEDGYIYYYETNNASIPSQAEFDLAWLSAGNSYKGRVAVSDGQKDIKLDVSGKYTYLMLQLVDDNGEEYKIVQLNVETGESNSDDTNISTDLKNGFNVTAYDYKKCQLVVVPLYSGKLNVSLGTDDKGYILTSNVYNVTENEPLTITYPGGITDFHGKPLCIIIQLEGVTGYKYAEWQIQVIPKGE